MYLRALELSDYIPPILEKYGDIGQFALPTALAVHALITGSHLEAISMGILGYLQKIEVFAIKRNFPVRRPGSYIPGQTRPEDLESFPSSHTGGAFLGAGLSIGLYGMSSPITIAAIALASLVGLSRYLSRKHWPSDILAGAVIGIIHGLSAAYVRKIPLLN